MWRSQFNIIVRHIVPNVLGVVVVYATLLVPSMILFESFLSFLGLGVQEPMTSWGALLNEALKIWKCIAAVISSWIYGCNAVLFLISLAMGYVMP